MGRVGVCREIQGDPTVPRAWELRKLVDSAKIMEMETLPTLSAMALQTLVSFFLIQLCFNDEQGIFFSSCVIKLIGI